MQTEKLKTGELQARVAIVTGGASGIGEGICTEFTAQGAKVVIADIDLEKARIVAANLKNAGAEAIAVGVDVTQYAEVRKCVEQAIATFGTVHILVNCAGVNRFSAPEAYSQNDWDKLIAINLSGPWYFCQAVIPEMMKNKYGKIVNIGSAAGVLGIPKAVPYSAAKHGTIGLTRSLAIDLGPHNINVNCVCPATIATPLLEKATNSAFVEGMLQRIPMGRLGKPQDIAKACLFLTSDAASWITGVVLPVDGGLTCSIRAHHYE
jgi:NAD(P)-dependent dehydrogenase (short-subunit alcohol dehydrogenase family)